MLIVWDPNPNHASFCSSLAPSCDPSAAALLQSKLGPVFSSLFMETGGHGAGHKSAWAGTCRQEQQSSKTDWIVTEMA
jgi:hypothetical protein